MKDYRKTVVPSSPQVYLLSLSVILWLAVVPCGCVNTASRSSQSPSMSTSMSLSRSTSSSPDVSISKTKTVSGSHSRTEESLSGYVSASATSSLTASSFPSLTASISSTFSNSRESGSVEMTATASTTPTASASLSASSALSSSVTKTRPSVSQTEEVSVTASKNVTPTKIPSPSPSPTSSASNVLSLTASDRSPSEEESVTVTPTITPPPTPSRTSLHSSTVTFVITGSISIAETPTKVSVSMSQSNSLSLSQAHTHTLDSLSPSKGSLTPTSSASPEASPSASPSTSLTPTSERSYSLDTMTSTFTAEVTRSGTKTVPDTVSAPISLTITQQMTVSVQIPTSTELPSPTKTLITACPPCNHGTCTDRPPFVCQCFLSYKLGFWSGGEVQGSTCSECVKSFFGASCKNACPGGVCTPCNNHGTCSDGVAGTGKCTCFTDPINGYWIGDSCDRCAAGFYGLDCRGVCNCESGKGSCQEGVNGNGRCQCVSGRSGDRCESCSSGFFLKPGSTNTTCIPCPGYSQEKGACNGNGECDPETGICYCSGQFTVASNCSVTDPNAINGCTPSCANNGTCRYGVCVCPSGFLGPYCEAHCPVAPPLTQVVGNASSVSAVCANQGVCYYDAIHNTANCSCFANNSFGYFDVDTNCSTCLLGYGGSGCATACPVALPTGGICNVNFLNSTVQNLCNRSTGTCNCPPGYCRANCSQSTGCDGTCPQANRFGLDCEHVCYNGTTINLRNSSGRCICDPGFVGTSCDIECRCKSNVTGVCPFQNDTCVCHTGYAGPTCAIVCPANPQTNVTCSNNGKCNEGNGGDGRCRCNDGFVGESCQTVCQCVNSSLGSCQSDGKCVCASSTWRVGDDCGSCEPGRAGFNCRTQCVNGITSGITCVCNATYGGPGCEKQCPSSGGLLCGGNGNCSSGNLGTGTCVCNPGFIGPSCNCTDAGCRAARENSACNQSTGQCDCVLPFGGEDCNTCALGYWGFSCRNVCPCEHGTCNRVTGACTCYADEQHGFWSGTLCKSCVAGYNQPDCVQLASVSTQIASFQSVFLKGKLFFTAKRLHVFEEYDIAVAIGPVTTVYANISQSIPVVRVQVQFHTDIAFAAQHCEYSYSWSAPRSPLVVVDNTTGGGSTLVAQPGNSLFIAQLCEFSGTTHFVVQEYPLLPIDEFFSAAQLSGSRSVNATFNVTVPNLVALVVMREFTYRNAAYLAAAVTVAYDGNSVNAFYSINFDKIGRVLQRSRSAIGLSDNLEATLSTMVAVEYDPVGERLLVVGSFDASGVSTDAQKLRSGTYILSFNPTDPGVTVRLFLNQYTFCTYARLIVVNHTSEAADLGEQLPPHLGGTPDISVLMMIQVTNGTQDFIRVNLTGGASVVSYPSRTTLTASDSTVAVVYDPLTGMLWSVCNNGRTFKIIKLHLCSTTYVTDDGRSVDTIGSQLLPAISGSDRRIVDMRPSLISRQLHLLQFNSSGTVVRRFLMYENLHLFPRTASRLSNPLITITGRGFINGTSSLFFPGNVPRCRIQSGTVKYQVQATLVNGTSSTQLICRLDASNTSLCSEDIVEVAIFDQFFTTSQLSIPRFQQPQLTQIVPSTTPFRDTLPTITIRGSGFADSGILMCKYSPENATLGAVIAPIAETVGTYVSSTTVLCGPPSVTQAIRLFVNVACDGVIFTEQMKVDANLIAIVGEPYNITTSVTTLAVDSAERVNLPEIIVSFVDDQSSSLVQTVSDRIQVFATFAGGLIPDGELSLVNDVGLFVFRSMRLLSPRDETGTSVTFRAVLLSGVSTNWVARIPITVSSGAPSNLLLTNTPSITTGIPETNRISVIEATVVDYAGNRVKSLGSSLSNETINATISLHFEVAPNVELPSELFALYPATDFQNTSEPIESGIVTFAGLEIGSARGGLIMWFLIETNVTRADGTRLMNATDRLIPKCNAGKLRFIGDTNCRSCPSHMQCPDAAKQAIDYGNLTLLVTVDPGFYRSTIYATQAVGCLPSFACVGGTGTGSCAEGYAGALCGLCEDTAYGRSIIGGDCVACYDKRVSGFLLFLVIGAIFAVFVLLTIGAVQNWAVTMEPVVSIALLMQHIHSILGIGLTGFNFSQFFKDAMSYMGIFSSRVLDYFFADCVLVGEGMTFYNKIVAFSLMPLLALFLASVAWLVVFVAPGFMRFERLQVEREQALNQRRDELLRRLARSHTQRRSAHHKARGQPHSEVESAAERMRRITDQAELTSIEHELKHNLKAQGVLPLHDYRILASHSLQVVLFFTFHTIIYYALTVFDCQDVPSGLGTVQSFLETDNRISCDSPEYHEYVGFGYVVSILYFLLVPILFVVLYKLHLRWKPAKVLQRRQLFYVFTIGLKTGSWYWSAVILLRKGLQFAIAAAVPSPADAHVSVWFFCIQLIWLLNLNPYWNWSNTFLEAVSLTSCIIASSLCILFEAYGTTSSRETISAVILTVMLIPIPLFVVSATQKVWQSVREEIKALRHESEEESSSASSGDEKSEAAHTGEEAKRAKGRPVAIGTQQRTAADVAPPGQQDGGNTAKVARSSDSSSRRLLRNVSVPAFFRIEDRTRTRGEEQKRLRELELNSPGRRSALNMQTYRKGGTAVSGAAADPSQLVQPLMHREDMRDDQRQRFDQRRFRDEVSTDDDDGDEIPALVPPSMSRAAAEAMMRGGRFAHQRGDYHDGSETTSEDIASDLSSAEARDTAGTSRGSAAVLDDTAQRVFEQMLRHDEATRRDRAFDDLMALEEERGATFPAAGEVLL